MAGFRGNQAEGRVAAQGPEQHTQGSRFVFQVYRVLRELPHGLPGNVLVPFEAYPLFHFNSSGSGALLAW